MSEDITKVELRRIIRDAQKELKELNAVDRVDGEVKKWEEAHLLKIKLNNICKDNNTTLVKLMRVPDFFYWAQLRGSQKAVDRDTTWLQEAVRRGTSLEKMKERADDLKRKRMATKLNSRKTSRKRAQKNLEQFGMGLGDTEDKIG